MAWDETGEKQASKQTKNRPQNRFPLLSLTLKNPFPVPWTRKRGSCWKSEIFLSLSGAKFYVLGCPWVQNKRNGWGEKREFRKLEARLVFPLSCGFLLQSAWYHLSQSPQSVSCALCPRLYLLSGVWWDQVSIPNLNWTWIPLCFLSCFIPSGFSELNDIDSSILVNMVLALETSQLCPKIGSPPFLETRVSLQGLCKWTSMLPRAKNCHWFTVETTIYSKGLWSIRPFTG